jgi:hypothetical protein
MLSSHSPRSLPGSPYLHPQPLIIPHSPKLSVSRNTSGNGNVNANVNALNLNGDIFGQGSYPTFTLPLSSSHPYAQNSQDNCLQPQQQQATFSPTENSTVLPNARLFDGAFSDVGGASAVGNVNENGGSHNANVNGNDQGPPSATNRDQDQLEDQDQPPPSAFTLSTHATHASSTSQHCPSYTSHNSRVTQKTNSSKGTTKTQSSSGAYTVPNPFTFDSRRGGAAGAARALRAAASGSSGSGGGEEEVVVVMSPDSYSAGDQHLYRYEGAYMGAGAEGDHALPSNSNGINGQIPFRGNAVGVGFDLDG